MKKNLTPDEYRAYQRANYAKHAEKRRAARKKRYYADLEESRRRGKEDYAKHREKRLAAAKKRYDANPEEAREKQRARYVSRPRVKKPKVARPRPKKVKIQIQEGQGHPDNIAFVEKWKAARNSEADKLKSCS